MCCRKYAFTSKETSNSHLTYKNTINNHLVSKIIDLICVSILIMVLAKCCTRLVSFLFKLVYVYVLIMFLVRRNSYIETFINGLFWLS